MDKTDPARTELAAAIAVRDAAAAMVEKALATEAQASDRHFAKLAARDAAQAAVVEAHGVSPLRLIEAAESGVLTLDRPLEMALTAESEAEDAVAASRRAVATSRAAIAEAQKSLEGAQWRVNEACKPVVAAEAAPLLVEARVVESGVRQNARGVVVPVGIASAGLSAPSPDRQRARLCAGKEPRAAHEVAAGARRSYARRSDAVAKGSELMPQQDTIRSFLVDLGWRSDSSGERRFIGAIEGATLKAP
jgi:hypothetical protein